MRAQKNNSWQDIVILYSYILSNRNSQNFKKVHCKLNVWKNSARTSERWMQRDSRVTFISLCHKSRKGQRVKSIILPNR